jgi:hypothetical protein
VLSPPRRRRGDAGETAEDHGGNAASVTGAAKTRQGNARTRAVQWLRTPARAPFWAGSREIRPLGAALRGELTCAIFSLPGLLRRGDLRVSRRVGRWAGEVHLALYAPYKTTPSSNTRHLAWCGGAREPARGAELLVLRIVLFRYRGSTDLFRYRGSTDLFRYRGSTDRVARVGPGLRGRR